MRCTKCGFISFDHLLSCGNCSTNLQEVSSLLHGTGVKAEPVFFLSSLLGAEEETAPPADEEVTLSVDEEEEVVLDIAEEEISEEQAEGGTEELEPALSAMVDEERPEMEMPAALSLEGEGEAEAVEQEMPVALSLEAEGKAEAAEQEMPEALELRDISAPGDNLTAGLEEIDLNDLMTEENGEGGEEPGPDEAGLSLEEEGDDEVEKIFDLSDILEDEAAGGGEEAAAASKESGAGEEEMSELDLELDLELGDEDE